MRVGTLFFLGATVLQMFTTTAIAGSSVYMRMRDADTLLGGLTFSGQPVSPDDFKYGDPYLEPIRASDLFKILNPPSLEDYARMRAMQPGGAPVEITDEIRNEYVSEINKKLNQLYVLKTMANILDTEAYLMKQSTAVPYERLEFAVRKILLDDGAVGSEEQLFQRLKEKIGKNPFNFTVDWAAKSKDARLSALARDFKENWPAARVMGQMPETLAEFRKLVQDRLSSIPKYFTRQKMVNTILVKDWRHRDLLNPFPVHNPQRQLDMFNPLGPARLVSEDELNAAYEELKDEVAARTVQEFEITEIKLGSFVSPLDPRKNEPEVNPAIKACVVKFKEFFETPYTERQKQLRDDLLAKLKDSKITREEFNAAVLAARVELPAAVFSDALKQLREFKDDAGKTPCADLPIELGVRKLKYDSRADYSKATEDLRLQLGFFAALQSDPNLQRMMIPSTSQIDTAGNVHHFFFSKAGETKTQYIPRTDREVDLTVRDVVASRRVADMVAESLKSIIGKRYVIHANTEPFSYEGIEGFQIKAAVTEPSKWLPQMFQGHSTKILESAYQMP